LENGIATNYHLHRKESGLYAFVLKGDVSINGIALNERDGLGITEIETLNITADSNAELLLMEVPMKP
jgi:redox-sensitive bicupin YhaK (pirin superfamily)